MPRTVDRALRKQELVEALWRIVERDGVEKASMRTIAAEAGVSLGALQHYFEDKDEILAAAVRMSQESFIERFRRARRTMGDEPDPRAVIETLLQLRLPSTAKQRRQAWALLHAVQATSAASTRADLLSESAAFVVGTIEEALDAARASRRLRRGLDIHVTAESLVALNEGLMLGLLFGRFTGPHARQLLDANLDLIFETPS